MVMLVLYLSPVAPVYRSPLHSSDLLGGIGKMSTAMSPVSADNITSLTRIFGFQDASDSNNLYSVNLFIGDGVSRPWELQQGFNALPIHRELRSQVVIARVFRNDGA